MIRVNPESLGRFLDDLPADALLPERAKALAAPRPVLHGAWVDAGTGLAIGRVNEPGLK